MVIAGAYNVSLSVLFIICKYSESKARALKNAEYP